MYKILNTQNFSVALALLLSILLSQTNVMNLFFSTVLGRIMLGVIILCISYTNHILGVVTTLFVIMIFACCYNYAENFETTIPVPAIVIANDNTTPDELDNDNQDALDNKYNVTEGFDVLGTERNLQRGKKSNTIMVNEDMRKSDNVDPYDGWNNPANFTSIS